MYAFTIPDLQSGQPSQTQRSVIALSQNRIHLWRQAHANGDTLIRRRVGMSSGTELDTLSGYLPIGLIHELIHAKHVVGLRITST